MSREEEKNAFHRSISFLNYRKVATWTALIAGIASAVVTLALLVLLWVFTDLMVHRGRLPSFSSLTKRGQEKFLERWNARPAEERQNMLQAVGYSESAAAELSLVTASREVQPRRSMLDDAFWRAELGQILRERVGDAAAGRLNLGENNVPPPGPNYDEIDHGLLSLVARSDIRGSLATPLVARVARWNPWTWNRGDGNSLLSTFLLGLNGIAFLLILLHYLLSLLSREMAARAAIEASTRLRRAVYHHTMRLGTLALRTYGPSEAVTVFTRHTEAIHDALYNRLISFFRDPVQIALFLIFAVVVHVWLALALLFAGVFVLLVGIQVLGYYRKRVRAASNQTGETLTVLRESLMMMRLVKSYLMEQFNQARVERQLAGHAQSQMVRYRSEAISFLLLVALGMIAALLFLFIGGVIVLAGQMSLAGLTMLVTAVVSMYFPLARWLETRRLIKRGEQASGELFSFLDRRSDVGQVVGADFLEPLGQQIEFDSVTLRDPGSSRMLLDNITLSIPAGSQVALVGANDAEKYAFVYLLSRLVDPTSGEIRIDNHNLRWVTLDSLRNQIATVLQQNLVFHDTVANNIGCGDPAYTLPQIIEAAKTAHAHQFIQKLPQGYETPIGELGHSLTTSQKFLIALARAVLRDPALFIIEEPEHELDEDTKSLLDDTFARVLPGRTTLFLPHRISTIRHCDTLFLFHKGRIAASGDHKKLIQQAPLYRHLYYLEFNEMDEQI